MSSIRMDINDSFDHVGHMGLYQILLYNLLGLLSLFSGMQSISINFIGAYQKHWCQVPGLSDFPHDVQKYIGIPYDEDGEYDTCRMYDVDYSNFTSDEIYGFNRTMLENTSTIECSSWVYDQSEFVSTINSELDLVCGKSWLNQLTSTLFMAGMLLGALVSGYFSDKFGRYPVCVTGVVSNLVVSIVASFIPSYAGFAIFRLLNSFTGALAYLGGFVLVIEVMGPAYRSGLSIFLGVYFALGYMVNTGVSYAIRDWRMFQFVISVPALGSILLLCLCPESPRWLVAKGRYEKAEEVLEQIAAINGRKLPDDFMKNLREHNEKIAQKVTSNVPVKGEFKEIWRSSILRREICILYLDWFTTALVYYGLSLNAAAFGDVFLNTFLSGVIEIPANLLCILCLEKGGRRYSNAASLLVAGALCMACVVILLTEPDLTDWLTALSTLGKGAITFAFGSIFLYTTEMFHTPVRHVALGSSSAVARIGSMISPYIGAPLEEIWRPMPTLIFGVLSIATGCLCFLLPETKGTDLPETLEQAEAIGRLKGKPTQKSDINIEQITPDFGDVENELSLIQGNETKCYAGSKHNYEYRNLGSSVDVVAYENWTFENTSRL